MKKSILVLFFIFLGYQGFSIRDMYVIQPEYLVGKNIKVVFDTKNSFKFSKNISISLNSDISSPLGSGDVSFIPKMSVKEGGMTKRQISSDSIIDSKGFLNVLIVGYSGNLLTIYGSYTFQVDGVGESIEIRGLVNPNDIEGSIVKFEDIVTPSITISRVSQQNITNVNLIPVPMPDGTTTIKIDIPQEEQKKIILQILNRIMSSF